MARHVINDSYARLERIRLCSRIPPNGCRSAFRDFDSPDSREASYSLRVVMETAR